MIEDETSPLREVLVGPPENFEWLPTSAISKAALASGVTLTRADVQAAHARDGVGLRGRRRDGAHACPPTRRCRTRCSPRLAHLGRRPARSSPSCTSRGAAASTRRCSDFYAGAGIEIAHMVTAGSLEGGDVVMPAARTALIGHCEERTRGRAARQLARVAGGAGLGGAPAALRPPLRAHRRDRERGGARAGGGLRRGAPPGLADWLRSLGLELIEVGYRDVHGAGRQRDVRSGEDRVVSTAAATALNERLRAHGPHGLRPRPVAVHDGRRRAALPGPAAARGARPWTRRGRSPTCVSCDRLTGGPEGRAAGVLDRRVGGGARRSCASAGRAAGEVSVDAAGNLWADAARASPTRSWPSARTWTRCPRAAGSTARSG